MKRTWKVHANPETGDIDPGALEALAADAATVARMVGGVVQIGVHRVEMAEDEFYTQAAMVRWDSYAPAQRMPADPGEEDGEDEVTSEAEIPEPVVTG